MGEGRMRGRGEENRGREESCFVSHLFVVFIDKDFGLRAKRGQDRMEGQEGEEGEGNEG